MNKEELKCPKCGNTDLVMCSSGAWNCWKCFTFVRQATKEEMKNNKDFKFAREIREALEKSQLTTSNN